MRNLTLTACEAEVMNVVWSKTSVTVQDVVDAIPRELAYTTVMTTMKILEDKGFLAHEIVGNIYQYYPVVSREDYQEHAITDIVKQYFNNSYPSMLAYFAKEEKISESELKQIIKLIKSNNK